MAASDVGRCDACSVVADAGRCHRRTAFPERTMDRLRVTRVGKHEVCVRQALSGENGVQISWNGGIEPRWRGDGKEIVYLGRDRKPDVGRGEHRAPSHRGPPSRLFTTRMLGFMATNTRNQYVVTADGQRFLINQPPDGASGSPLTVVVNWTAALHP